MKIKILLLALCILHQTYTAHPPSLEDATNLLASMCRFTRGLDYVANPDKQNPQLTQQVANQALAFLWKNKRNPQKPTGTLLEACRTCAFTSPDGQVFATVWQAAENLKQIAAPFDYMVGYYTMNEKK